MNETSMVLAKAHDGLAKLGGVLGRVTALDVQGFQALVGKPRAPGRGLFGADESPVGNEVLFLSLLTAASAGVSAYHGYKRNNSVGWAIAWGVLGSIFPVITPAVALAEGFGKRAK